MTKRVRWAVIFSVFPVAACGGAVVEPSDQGSGGASVVGGGSFGMPVAAGAGFGDVPPSKHDAGIGFGCLYPEKNIDVTFAADGAPDAGAQEAGLPEGAARPCSAKLPDVSPYVFEPMALNVGIPTGTGLGLISAVHTSAECMDVGSLFFGWYYDDPAHPKRIDFCSETCREIGEAGGTVTVYFGCVNYPRLQ